MTEYTPIQDVGYTTDRLPVIGARLMSLQPGTPVRLTRDGRDHELAVQRSWRDGSLDHAPVTVGYGPGRWNTEVTAAGIMAGFMALAVPEGVI